MINCWNSQHTACAWFWILELHTRFVLYEIIWKPSMTLAWILSSFWVKGPFVFFSRHDTVGGFCKRCYLMWYVYNIKNLKAIISLSRMKEYETEFSSIHVICHSNCQATLFTVAQTVITFFRVMFGWCISWAGDPVTVKSRQFSSFANYIRTQRIWIKLLKSTQNTIKTENFSERSTLIVWQQLSTAKM